MTGDTGRGRERPCQFIGDRRPGENRVPRCSLFAQHVGEYLGRAQQRVVLNALDNRDYGNVCRNAAFQPIPKVQSCFIRLSPYKDLPIKAKNFSAFKNITLLAFTNRRKTIYNALNRKVAHETFESLKINPKCRPEELSVIDFVNISNCLDILETYD